MAVSVQTAQARADAARARLMGTVHELQSRLAPQTLAKNAIETVSEKSEAAAKAGVDAVQRNPAVAGGALAGAVGLLGFRFWRKRRKRKATVYATPRSDY